MNTEVIKIGITCSLADMTGRNKLMVEMLTERFGPNIEFVEIKADQIQGEEYSCIVVDELSNYVMFDSMSQIESPSPYAPKRKSKGERKRNKYYPNQDWGRK